MLTIRRLTSTGAIAALGALLSTVPLSAADRHRPASEPSREPLRGDGVSSADAPLRGDLDGTRDRERRPRVSIPAQLMITDLAVVEDPVRTDPRNPRAPWTFRHLIEELAGPHDPSDFVLDWLRQWESDQVTGGHVVEARPAIRELVIEPWLAASGGGRLDLSKAPFRLLAIVNRLDLRVHDGPDVEQAGEGRFVFGVTRQDGTPLPPAAGPAPGGFLLIFEYRLVARDMQDLRDWTMRWAELGRHELGSDRYREELERVTRAFSDVTRLGREARLNQLRTNEISLAPSWQLREFVVDRRSGWLRSEPMAGTPDTVELNGTPELAELVNAFTPELLEGTFTLPLELEGMHSLAGPFVPSDFPDFPERTFTVLPLGAGPAFDAPWSAAGIASNEARHQFGLATCNGCHRDETATGFVHVGFPADHDLPATLAVPATLSGFLRGVDAVDPVDSVTTRRFDDLERRRADFVALLASFDDGRDGPVDDRHRPRRPH